MSVSLCVLSDKLEETSNKPTLLVNSKALKKTSVRRGSPKLFTTTSIIRNKSTTTTTTRYPSSTFKATTSVTECFDDPYTDCATYEHLCAIVEYKDIMTDTCPRTCGFCKAISTFYEDITTVACVDTDYRCVIWEANKDHPYCDNEFYPIAIKKKLCARYDLSLSLVEFVCIFIEH
uniref:ShKT domain-containing protein n=1 Tax=Heterorhabditis bacteriophora TaxID=37862 RepID=A0A1I7XEK2_HETBA